MPAAGPEGVRAALLQQQAAGVYLPVSEPRGALGTSPVQEQSNLAPPAVQVTEVSAAVHGNLSPHDQGVRVHVPGKESAGTDGCDCNSQHACPQCPCSRADHIRAWLRCLGCWPVRLTNLEACC